MRCEKCKQPTMVLIGLKVVLCGCGSRKASKELLEHAEEMNRS